MPALTSKQLAQRLAQLEKEELEQMVLQLNARFEEVKHFCQMELGDTQHQQALLDTYKTQIYKQFFPARKSRNHRPKTSKLKKTTQDFKKIAVFPLHLIDLKLYWVEVALQYLHQSGYVHDAFFAPTEANLQEVGQLLEEHQLGAYFQERIANMTELAQGLRYYSDFGRQLKKEVLQWNLT